VTADVRPHRLRFYQPGEERTSETSLQLEIQTNEDCYLTVADVDAEGGVNLLFPNEPQRPDFLQEGLIRAGSAVFIPDSLKSPNRAGFYFDYGPPTGADTVRAFCATQQGDAATIRKGVQQVSAASRSTPETAGASAAALLNLRKELTSLANRGLTGIRPSDKSSGGSQPPSPSSAPTPPDWAASSITLEITAE
jgi:hypothetical protein